MYLVYDSTNNKNISQIKQELKGKLASSLFENEYNSKLWSRAQTESQRLTITLVKAIIANEFTFKLTSNSTGVLEHIEFYQKQLAWKITNKVPRFATNGSKKRKGTLSKSKGPVRKSKVIRTPRVSQPNVKKIIKLSQLPQKIRKEVIPKKKPLVIPVKEKKQPIVEKIKQPQQIRRTSPPPSSIYRSNYTSFEKKSKTFIDQIEDELIDFSLATTEKPLFGKKKEIKPLGIKRIIEVLESDPASCQNYPEYSSFDTKEKTYREMLFEITEILYSMINSPVKKRCCTYFYRDNGVVKWYEDKFVTVQVIIKNDYAYEKNRNNIENFIIHNNHRSEHECWKDNCWGSKDIVRITGPESKNKNGKVLTGEFGIN